MKPRTYRLAQLLDGFYLSKQAQGCSPKTLADYQGTMVHFGRWCQANSKTDPTRLTAADVRAFLAHLRTQPNGRGGLLSPKSILNIYVGLRAFYRWLAEETGMVNPMLSVQAPKVQPALIEPLSREEVDKLLRACEFTREARPHNRRAFTMERETAARDRAMVLLLVDSGLRSGELCALRVEDLDRDTGRILVRHGKGNKPRVSYLGKVARKALWRYRSQREEARAEEPLFATREGRAFSPDRITRLFLRLGERAGVPNVHPHRLRHSFATELLKNGANLFALQQLLGHSSLLMVKRYAQVAEVDLATAHEANSPADRWRL